MAGKNELELLIRIGGKVDGSLGAAVNVAQRQVSGLSRGLSAVAKAAGVVTATAAGAVAAVGAASVKSAASLEQRMSQVQTLLVGSEQKISEEMRRLTGGVMQSSIATGIATEEMADGLYQVVSAFGDVAKAADAEGLTAITEIAAKAAKAGQAEMVPTVNALAATTKAYGDTSEEAVQKVADLTFETIRLGQTTMPELAEGIQKATGSAAALGVSQEELYAGFAALTGVIGNTETVGTALNTLYAKMLKPSKELAGAVAALGYESAYAMVQQEGLGNSLKLLYDSAGQSPTAFAALFSMRDLKAAQGIIRVYDSYEKKLGDLKKATQYKESEKEEKSPMLKAFRTSVDNTNSSMEIISNSVRVLGQQLGMVLMPYVKEFAQTVVPVLADWVLRMGDAFQTLAPYVSAAAGAVFPAMGTALQSVGTALERAVPLLVQFFDAVGRNGDTAVKVLGGVAAAWAAMLFAPKIELGVRGLGYALLGAPNPAGEVPGGRAARSGGLAGLITGGQAAAARAGAVWDVINRAGRDNALGAAGPVQGLSRWAAGALTAFGYRNGLTSSREKTRERTWKTVGTLLFERNDPGLGALLGQMVTNSGPVQWAGRMRNSAGALGGALSNVGGAVRDWAAQTGPGEFLRKNLGRHWSNLFGTGGLNLGNPLTLPLTLGGRVMNFARGKLAQGGMLQTAAGFAAPVLQGAGGLMANLYGPVAGVFGSLFSGAAPVLAAVSAVTAAVMLLTDHLQDVRGLVERVFGARGARVFDTMVGAVGAVKDKIVQTFSRENLAQVQGNLNLAFGPQVSGAFGALVQVFEGVRSVMGRVAEFAANTVKPLFEQVFGWMAGVAAPKLLAVFEACAPYIGELIANAGGLVMDGLQMIGTAIEAVLPVIGWLVGKFLDLAAVVGPAILQALAVFTGENGLGAVFAGLQKVLGGVIDFVAGVFTDNWEQAWNGVRSIFGGIFESLAGLVKAPLNAVISLVNRAIAGINSIKIPQWARGFAGGAENLDLPQIPMLAKGGFTAGPSLAGEAGTEAVISFDRRVRGRNLQTWAAAGRLLGADGGWTPGGLAAGGGAQKVEVQFAPNITITGNASREDVSAAMNEAYEQFVAFMKRYERTKVRVAF